MNRKTDWALVLGLMPACLTCLYLAFHVGRLVT